MIDPRVEEAVSPPEPANDSDADPSDKSSERLPRDAQLLNEAAKEWLRKKIDHIAKGFEKQSDRSDDLEKWWNIYNCHLDDQQYYNGTAQVYIPAIRDAIEARATRFTNQLFPQSGQYVNCTTTDGEQPYEILAIINHYLSGSDSEIPIKTNIVKPLFETGDIEGQYNLYVDWNEVERLIVSRETRTPPGAPEEISDIEEEEVTIGFPGLEILHDADVLVLPQTANCVLDALQSGGSATIVRRWSKDKCEEMLDADEIEGDEDGDEEKIDRMGMTSPGNAVSSGLVDLAKRLMKAVGVKGGDYHMTAFETWQMVPLDGKGRFSKKGRKRLCRYWWGIDREPLGLKRNPYWNDRCPLLSHPRKKVAGVFKGKSAVEPLAPVQYEINDAANERSDVDHMGAMPIIRRDPAQGGNVPLIIAPGAVWKAAAGEIEFLEFPNLSDRGKGRILDGLQIIMSSLGVNPSMLPGSTGVPGRKRNQAEIAMEQQVDLLTTAETVSAMEQGILNPMLAWIADLDHQFRSRDMTVKAYGRFGYQANMIDVSPMQNGRHYRFNWLGAEEARWNMALQQGGTAMLNVLRGMKQDIAAEGFELKIGPFAEKIAAHVVGPTIASLMLVDKRHHMSIPPDIENGMLMSGNAVPTSPFDNPMEHIQSHQQSIQMEGDPTGDKQIHLQMHLLKLAEQQAAIAAQQAGGGAPGVPGGAGPGVAGTPPPGAAPAGPRPMKGPPGMISQDQLPRAGAAVPPRRA